MCDDLARILLPEEAFDPLGSKHMIGPIEAAVMFGLREPDLSRRYRRVSRRAAVVAADTPPRSSQLPVYPGPDGRARKIAVEARSLDLLA